MMGSHGTRTLRELVTLCPSQSGNGKWWKHSDHFLHLTRSPGSLSREWYHPEWVGLLPPLPNQYNLLQSQPLVYWYKVGTSRHLLDSAFQECLSPNTHSMKSASRGPERSTTAPSLSMWLSVPALGWLAIFDLSLVSLCNLLLRGAGRQFSRASALCLLRFPAL